MRIQDKDRDYIKQATVEIFGSDARVCLFGSRLDNTRSGGDVDLFVESSLPVKNPAYLAARLGARVSRRFQGRKVDVVVSAPNLQLNAVHRIAKDTGVSL